MGVLVKRVDPISMVMFSLKTLGFGAATAVAGYAAYSYLKPTQVKIIISGGQGSGKGTQCELIKEKFGVHHISTGDLLREHVKKGTAIGLEAKGYMDRGDLVPDSVMIGIVKEELAKPEASKGWLLDGFPRTQKQAEALNDNGIIPQLFVLLEVPDDVLMQRCTGRRMDKETGKIYHVTFNPPPPEREAFCYQRSDDMPEKIQNRLV